MRLVWLIAALAAACGPGGGRPAAKAPGAPVETKPAPPAERRVLLTVLSGSIDGARADGTPWDDRKRKPAAFTAAGGPMSRWLAQHPELEGAEAWIGQPVELGGVTESALESTAADPMVLVEVGGKVFRSPLRPGQFQPVWQFGVVVKVKADDVVRLTVVDWDGAADYDVIGEKVLEGAALLGGKVVEVPRFGNVEKLTLTVEDAPAEARHRVSVPARPTWTDTGIPVIAGQDVIIMAAGTVCTAGDDRARCAGPEGQSAHEKNVKGFEKRGHGMLIGAVGDVRFVVGRERRFLAPSTGPLLLGVNDVDSGNNKGELEVSVTVK